MCIRESIIAPVLKKHPGAKRHYLTHEGNDPNGDKANVAKNAKADLGIVPRYFPTYSPE